MMKKMMKWMVAMAMTGWVAVVQAAGHGVMVENPWIREAPPTASALGGFMVVMNHADKAAILVGASTAVAEEVQLHRTVMEDGMAKMIHQHMIEIPAGGQVEFKPGDYHLMLMKPKQALKAGDKVEIILQFKDGGTLPATFEVRAMGGMGMDHGSMHKH